MDLIKVTKVKEVTLTRFGVNSKGTLHLTTHHMIFRDADTSREHWFCYPMLSEVQLKLPSASSPVQVSACMHLRCKDFIFFALSFKSSQSAVDVFDSIMRLSCVPSLSNLYAFAYSPGKLEKSLNGWKLFSPEVEFERQGALKSGLWRKTDVNNDYSLCVTYPTYLVVPSSISDTIITHGARFRSKNRMPVLTYFHKMNQCTITRCSQPMVGLKQNRSVQDERLVGAVLSTTAPPAGSTGSQTEHLIIDARPTTNAVAQTALGAGTENMENYRPASKVYSGIDNIHVMRDSINKVTDALKHGDVSPLMPSQEALAKSHWLKYIRTILQGAIVAAEHVHFKCSHVVIHCSDGWDRTTQLTSLAQMFLDPYFRTIDGFITLVEKDWVSFGHRFSERSGHIGHESSFHLEDPSSNQAQILFNKVVKKTSGHSKYTSPVFHQFLDCVYQTLYQFPTKFEFNERFLRRLLYHLYSCQYGTFLYNNPKEREEAKLSEKTRSVWDYFLARRDQFTNKDYKHDGDDDYLAPDVVKVRWWSESFCRGDHEMNRPKATYDYEEDRVENHEVEREGDSADPMELAAESGTLNREELHEKLEPKETAGEILSEQLDKLYVENDKSREKSATDMASRDFPMTGFSRHGQSSLDMKDNPFQ